MNPRNLVQLKSYYYGQLTASDRLETERSLLEDSEVLLDYIDLKRELEMAEGVPSSPTEFLWQRIEARDPLSSRRIVAFRERTLPRKQFVFSLSVAAVVAASLVYVFNWVQPQRADEGLGSLKTVTYSGTIFDSKSELPQSSDVF